MDVGDGAVLDGYDATRRVGFDLRGRAPEQTRMHARAETEPSERALDDEEMRALERQGVRALAADLERYPLMDGDQFTPTLAWLAGLAAFLNEVAGGPEIDLSALLFARAQRFPLPSAASLSLPEGLSAGVARNPMGATGPRVAVSLGGGGKPPPNRPREARPPPPATPDGRRRAYGAGVRLGSCTKRAGFEL